MLPVPPLELELLELEEELELEELLLELDELELELLEELDEDELELLLLPLEAEMVPAEAARVTRSSFAPSSRRTTRNTCEPAERLLKVAGVMLAQPEVCVLFCVLQAPESSL